MMLPTRVAGTAAFGASCHWRSNTVTLLAWVFCVSWRAEFAFRVTQCRHEVIFSADLRIYMDDWAIILKGIPPKLEEKVEKKVENLLSK